jgi:hypothetical protein
MKKIWLFVLGLLILILLFVLIKQKPTPPVTPLGPSPSVTANPPITVDTSDLQAGGSSYRDVQGVYLFLYPSDYKLDEQNNGTITRIYKTGPTQRGQTEMYDGAIITFETIDLQGETLSKWADEYIKNATADGTTKLTETKKSITQRNYPGFTFTLEGLGEAKYLVLQKDTSSHNAVIITTFVADPQNVGFQQEVDKTLMTLELLK